MRWLSRLAWYLGRNRDAERYAQAAVETLERGPRDAELAMAYSNMSQLRMLASDMEAAQDWGERALELAREVGDRGIESHALNNVGVALCDSGSRSEGFASISRSLDIALADDLHEHAARAFTNMGSQLVTKSRPRDAVGQLRAGIDYCIERDLDSWALYMLTWLAWAELDLGHAAEAAAITSDVLRRPELPAVTRIPALLVTGLLAVRQGRPGDALDEALRLAEETGEPQRLLPVAAARAEAAWTAGRTSDAVAEVERVWPLAARKGDSRGVGELAYWAAVGGRPRHLDRPVDAPFRAILDGDAPRAAQMWADTGPVFWRALALGHSDDPADVVRGAELLTAMDAPASRAALLRDAARRGVRVPRGPRRSTRANPAGLTTRELQILDLMADGLSNAELARRLVLSERTIGHHVSAVLRKLGEPTRTAAVAAAIRQGWVRQT